MASFSLTSPVIHVHDLDLAGYLKKFTVHPTVDEIDVTPFGPPPVYHARIPGLKTVETQGEGFWDSTPDASIFADLAVVDRVLTASPEGAETKVAYMFQTGRFGYEAFGQVGEAAPFVTASKSTNPNGLVRGQLAKAKGSVSATGQLGSILQLTAVGATQSIYATVHVFSPAGTTITIQVQSAAAVGFGAPTLRATIGPLTATGGTWLKVTPGVITDAFWRFNVSAITGTFIVAGALGIQ